MPTLVSNMYENVCCLIVFFEFCKKQHKTLEHIDLTVRGHIHTAFQIVPTCIEFVALLMRCFELDLNFMRLQQHLFAGVWLVTWVWSKRGSDFANRCIWLCWYVVCL